VFTKGGEKLGGRKGERERERSGGGDDKRRRRIKSTVAGERRGDAGREVPGSR